MKIKKLKPILKTKLAAYSSIAGALIAVSGSAEAKVVYTDINPDLTFNTNLDTFKLDLDNNAVLDFMINLKINSAAGFFGNSVTASPLAANAINASTTTITISTKVYVRKTPYAMIANDPIGSAQMWQTAASQFLALSFKVPLNFGTAGNWPGATDKYLGLKFDIGGQTHYGWARLTISATAISFTIKDYAYEDIADTVILAGDTGALTSVSLPKIEELVSAYSFGNRIFLNLAAVEGNRSVEVFDIKGRQVYRNDKISSDEIITIDDANGGLYIVKVTLNGSVLTRKLFLKS
ncbi:MAG: T9SS type A sorting domain-containing protein [Bacteroidetes bacterium]|nr:T9SS type A sorting domain-containing protein [Bacteroidota bacterium]